MKDLSGFIKFMIDNDLSKVYAIIGPEVYNSLIFNYSN